MSLKKTDLAVTILFIGIVGLLILSPYIHLPRFLISKEAHYVQTLEEHCGNRPTQYNCLEPFVTETIRTEGLDAGLEMIKAWYLHTPEFRQFCDAFTRYVGVAAEKKIKDYEALTYTEKSVWCNYGFYHGYMQAYMAEVQDVEKGTAFCTHIGEKLHDSAPGAQSECFRALGYAIVLLTGAKEKDISKIAETSVKQCRTHAKEPLDVRLCEEGVFSELGQVIATGEYGAISKDNPLWLCDQQQNDMQTICYATMKWLPLISFDIRGEDIIPGFKKIEERYSEQEIQELSKTIEQLVFTLAYNQARRGTSLPAAENYKKGTDACAALPSMFLNQCISGFGFGLAKGGKPGEQYHEVLAFCEETSKIPGYPVKECAPSSLEYLGRYYSHELFKKVCTEFETSVGTSCAN